MILLPLSYAGCAGAPVPWLGRSALVWWRDTRHAQAVVLTRRARALQARMKTMVDDIVTAVAAVERAFGGAGAVDRGSGTRLTGVGVRNV